MIQIIINDIANKVRATVLTGLSTASNVAIAATDSIIVAFGKLQAQITAHITNTSNPHNTTAAQVGAPSGSGTSTGTNTGDQDLSGLQIKRIVVSSNQTAVIDGAYTLVASATFTDPTPQEGKGFSVLLRNGTATIGGTPYSTAGTTVWRVFHSGSWANYVNQNSLGFTPESIAVQRSGTSITFDAPANYGTLGTPETGNITGDYTGARIGVVQLIIHNDSVAPTIPATWVIDANSNSYVLSVVNYIYVEWLSSNIARYTIGQNA